VQLSPELLFIDLLFLTGQKSELQVILELQCQARLDLKILKSLGFVRLFHCAESRDSDQRTEVIPQERTGDRSGGNKKVTIEPFMDLQSCCLES
jgi:hypothetical protein